MANSTLKGALAIHGGNPQFLIEKVIRARIYDSIYWKSECFALTAESIIDKALDLKAVGGVYANQRPTEFLCLTLKLLVLQPEKEILLEYLRAEEFKYLRALAAFYIRLTFRSVDVFEILEPLMKDYRKLRVRDVGGYHLTYMDEFIDQLLTEERVCDVILPRLTKRDVLEDTEGLVPRTSLLEEAMNPHSDSGSENASPSRKRRRITSPSRRRFVSRSATPEEMDWDREPSRTPSSAYASEGYRSRSGSISPDREVPGADGANGSGEVGENNKEAEEDERDGRYVSRSPSAGSYRSRSGSISPDRS